MALSVECAVGRRRLATTNRGHLALVNDDVCRGDLVGILYGGGMPLILRRGEPNMHSFHGECYVHGLMFGKAVEDLETDDCDYSPTIFHIAY